MRTMTETNRPLTDVAMHIAQDTAHIKRSRENLADVRSRAMVKEATR